MRRRGIGLLGGAALLLAEFAGCACGPTVATPVPEDAAERYAEAMCAAAERCGCIGDTFTGDLDQCRAERVGRFEAIARWPDMEFDLECFEDLLTWLDSDQCHTVDEYRERFPPTVDRCRVFRGTRRRGDSCAPTLYEPGGDVLSIGPDNGGLTVGPCRPGVNCWAGTCSSGQRIVDQGKACHLRLDVRCAGEDGYYCARDGTCKRRAGPGEPCDTPIACEEFHRSTYCEGISPDRDAVGTCSSRIALGEACDPTSAVNPCSDHGYCDPSGTCVPQQPALCYFVAEPPGNYFPQDWVPL